MGLHQDPLRHLWGSVQNENVEPLFKNYYEFRDDQQSSKPSPSQQGARVTAQAGMPMKPALASICLSPQLSPRCPRGSRSRLQPWSAMLPNLPERRQGREGRPGESRGRAQRPADLLPMEPFQTQAMPDSGPRPSVPSGAHCSPHQATN